MLGYFFKAKRRIQHHELAGEYYRQQLRKNSFLRLYIILLSLGMIFMLFVNGSFKHNAHWGYVFALTQKGALTHQRSVAIASPISDQLLKSYAKEVIYRYFAITPQTLKRNYNQLFNSYFIYNTKIHGKRGYADRAFDAAYHQLYLRVKNGWYFSVEQLPEPVIKTHHNHGVILWNLTYQGFVLYGVKDQSVRRTKSDLTLTLVKTPFMDAPGQLSAIRIFQSHVQDIGSRYGY